MGEPTVFCDVFEHGMDGWHVNFHVMFMAYGDVNGDVNGYGDGSCSC